MTKKGGTVGPICPPGQMYDPLAGKCMPKPKASKPKKKLFKGAGKEIMQPYAKKYKDGGYVITGRD
tara:strand:- start:5994 stop:6191 length:198 start_codon:yes stop_codon:yes gene_type:complete